MTRCRMGVRQRGGGRRQPAIAPVGEVAPMNVPKPRTYFSYVPIVLLEGVHRVDALISA